jgi:hypothetical protein
MNSTIDQKNSTEVTNNSTLLKSTSNFLKVNLEVRKCDKLGKATQLFSYSHIFSLRMRVHYFTLNHAKLMD